MARGGAPDNGKRGAPDNGKRGAPDNGKRGALDNGKRGALDNGKRGACDNSKRGACALARGWAFAAGMRTAAAGHAAFCSPARLCSGLFFKAGCGRFTWGISLRQAGLALPVKRARFSRRSHPAFSRKIYAPARGGGGANLSRKSPCWAKPLENPTEIIYNGDKHFH